MRSAACTALSASCKRPESARSAAEVQEDDRLEPPSPRRAQSPRPELHGGRTQPGVGLRHHLHLDRGGLAVSRVHAGSLLAQGRRLGHGLVHDGHARGGRLADGDRPPLAAAWPAPSFRPRRAVRRARLPGPARAPRHHLQHERQGQLLRQCREESFFHTLKTELCDHEHYQTRAQARASVFEFIEVFYNRQRLHSTLGYCSPSEFEAQRVAV